ncbi:MAG: hypothetical protein PHD51_01955 [Patescibacteria group bacterium]|nr:hypothetical protein [Patescibacteria group bacterium]
MGNTEYVAEEMAKYKVENPVIFEILSQALLDKGFVNKPEVMLCLLKILEQIKNQRILTTELIITPETSKRVNKENQGKNLYREFLRELEKWGKINKDLAISIGIALTIEITATKDQEKSREYMGVILKNIRLECKK